MKNRRAFLAAFAASGASLALASAARAEPSPEPGAGGLPSPVSPTPGTSPKPQASVKAPSAAAIAIAATMRRFDPKLTGAELETIARGIDANADAGAKLNPRKKRLANGDEPVTSFIVPFA